MVDCAEFRCPFFIVLFLSIPRASMHVKRKMQTSHHANQEAMFQKAFAGLGDKFVVAFDGEYLHGVEVCLGRFQLTGPLVSLSFESISHGRCFKELFLCFDECTLQNTSLADI